MSDGLTTKFLHKNLLISLIFIAFYGKKPLGLHMDQSNRWIKMVDSILWDEVERRYAELFESDTGNPAKPLCLALGYLIIQSR